MKTVLFVLILMRIVLNNNKDAYEKIILLTFAFTVIFSYQLKADNEILVNYSNIAEAKYKDALILAKEMHSSIEKFMNNTNESTFIDVKDSWLKARTIYQQTEVFRFGNPLVDDWEGKVNAWPLDEGLIDYVDNTNYYPSENDIWNQKLDNPIKYVNDRAANVSLLYFPQVEFAHRYGKITLQNHQKLSSLNNFNTNANYMILSEQLMLRQMVDVENIPFFPLAKNIWDCHQIRYTGDTEPKGKWSLNEAHKYYKHYGVEKGRLIGNYEQPQRNLTYEREIEYLNRCIKAGKLIDTESLFKKINEIKQP